MVSAIENAGSVETNISSLIALSSLQAVGSSLNVTFKAVETGYRIADPYDDGSAYSLAQGLRGDIAATAAINQRLHVAKGIVGVAVQAGTSISVSLSQAQTLLTTLADQSLTRADRSAYEAQYNVLRTDILSFIDDATYNNISIVNAGAASLSIISNIQGGVYTIQSQDLVAKVYDQLSNVTGSYSSAAGLIVTGGGLRSAVTNLGLVLTQLAADVQRLNNQIAFNDDISGATTTGLGQVVDADLTKAGAVLNATQARRQLTEQSLSLANQAPNYLLNLLPVKNVSSSGG